MEEISQLMNDQQQKGLETTRSEEIPRKKLLSLQSPTHSKYFYFCCAYPFLQHLQYVIIKAMEITYYMHLNLSVVV